jgi:surface protein
MFGYCKSLISLDVSNWNVSKVQDLWQTFVHCENLIEIVGIENWNLNAVFNANSIFYGCTSLKSLDLSKWNLRSATTFAYTFALCASLEQLLLPQGLDRGIIRNLNGLFQGCSLLEHIDMSNIKYDYSESTSIMSIFRNCNNLRYVDISNLDLISDIPVIELFLNDNSLTDIGMVHCDVETINIVAAQTPVQPITIWIGTHLTAEEIASLDQYDHITYSIQLENAERLLLSSPLLEGDEIKVVDGKLCHVHNMGMVVLDGSGDEGWMTALAGDDAHVRFATGTLIPNVAEGNTFNCISSRYAVPKSIGDIYLNNTGYVFKDNTTMGRYIVTNIKRNITEFINELKKEPLTVVYELAEPYTEVIDLPRANIDVELYENGVLHMSDPTASTNRVDSDGNMIIDAIQGDSVVNVSNQQFSIELSEETNTTIQTGEVLEDNAIRPKFYGKTMVNLMDRIGWEKFTPEYGYVAYVYRPTDITNRSITITNFNDKPIRIGIFNTDDNNADNRTINIDAKSTNVIVLSSVESLFSIAGLTDNGWTEENMHELKNVNIFEGELSDDELPENRMSGMRNAFDKYQTSEGKYRVEMVVSNSPIQFGKAGRK